MGELCRWELCSFAVVQMGEFCSCADGSCAGRSQDEVRGTLASPPQPPQLPSTFHLTASPIRKNCTNPGISRFFENFELVVISASPAEIYFKISSSRSIRLRSGADCSVLSLEESYVVVSRVHQNTYLIHVFVIFFTRTHFFGIFGLLSYRYNIYQVRIEFLNFLIFWRTLVYKNANVEIFWKNIVWNLLIKPNPKTYF